MFSMRCGRAPHSLRPSACAGLIALALVLAGCANERTSRAAPTPANMAGIRAEIEADGLPAQLAPRHYAPKDDDPREPWSPNYGSVSPAKTTDAAPPVAPSSPARVIHARYSRPIDADDVIRRAVAEHEIRHEDP